MSLMLQERFCSNHELQMVNDPSKTASINTCGYLRGVLFVSISMIIGSIAISGGPTIDLFLCEGEVVNDNVLH
jgi:hypothetical protein